MLDMIRDADTCMRLLRAAGSSGWKHLMQAFRVLEMVAQSGVVTEEAREILRDGKVEEGDVEG